MQKTRRVIILGSAYIALRRIEHIALRWLHLLVEFKHLDDVSFLAVASATVMSLILARVLVLIAKEVILRLVVHAITSIILSLLIVS